MLHSLKYTKWVVYCKPPFSTPENVLQYIGRYSHRVAISNNRIVNIEKAGLLSNGEITKTAIK